MPGVGGRVLRYDVRRKVYNKIYLQAIKSPAYSIPTYSARQKQHLPLSNQYEYMRSITPLKMLFNHLLRCFLINIHRYKNEHQIGYPRRYIGGQVAFSREDSRETVH